jgi:hypothetical protein
VTIEQQAEPRKPLAQKTRLLSKLVKSCRRQGTDEVQRFTPIFLLVPDSFSEPSMPAKSIKARFQ